MPHRLEAHDSAFGYYPALQRVKEYVETNLEEEISLEMAARVAGLEEKYFSAFFRRRTGVGFKAWLTELRIQRAKDMLRERDHRITSVAFSVGYRDLRTFERAFKRHTGMTPRSFKASVRP